MNTSILKVFSISTLVLFSSLCAAETPDARAIMQKVYDRDDGNHSITEMEMILIDKNGEEIDRIVGYLETDEFLKTLDDYQKGIGTLPDLLNRAKTETDRPLYFEIADKYKYRGAPEPAREWYDKVVAAGEPTDSLSGEARMALADMERRAKNYDAALDAFEAIMTDFSGKQAATDAEIWRAIVYRLRGDTTNAISVFEQYIVNHPESEDVEYARSQIARLKGDTAQSSH